MSAAHATTGGDVVVVGSANIDLTLRVASLPAAGETVLGDDAGFSAGGKGANQAVAAALSGGRVRLVGCVGADGHGEVVRAALSAAGVDVELVRVVDDRPTGLAVVLVARSGENAIAVSPGANSALAVADVREAVAGLGPADVVLAQLEIPPSVAAEAMAAAASVGCRAVLNLAPARTVSRETLAAVEVLVVNQSEAEFLLGAPVADVAAARDGAPRLRALGPAAVVVTLGSHGAVVGDDAGTRHVPARAVEVVDTSGAGDAFVGALGAALAAGASLDDAVAAAAECAAAAVRSPGAQLSPSHGETVRRGP